MVNKLIKCRCCGKPLGLWPETTDWSEFYTPIDGNIVEARNAFDGYCADCKGEVESIWTSDAEIVTYQRKEVYTDTFADRTDTLTAGELTCEVNYDPDNSQIVFIWVRGPRGLLYFESHFCGNEKTKYFDDSDGLMTEEVESIIRRTLRKGGTK